MSWAKLAIFTCLILGVTSDTPANCTFDDARGSWTFILGPSRNLKSCNTDSGEKINVTLQYPDRVTDQYGNMGFWTLIYNQGFEVVIGGRKYFGFFKYIKLGKKVLSICDELQTGWSHDVLGRRWICFKAAKNQKIPPKIHYEEEILGSNERMQLNHAFVNEINRQQKSWWATVYPEVVHMTREQNFLRRGGPRSRILGRPRPARISDQLRQLALSLPPQFDWRNVSGRSYVSPVRNQGRCGSCYSFSSIGMLESRLLILRNTQLKLQLSEQDVVDCSPYAQGCNGGFPYLIAGKYAEDFGVVTESCNPYTGIQSNKCTTNTSSPLCQKRYFGTHYQYVGGYYGACNEALMQIALVNNGPLSVSFEVYPDFEAYRGGIYHHTGLTDRFNPFQLTNHAVLLVGYGQDATSGEKFWIVKNSWGEQWGEKGYFRIRRGTDECAIESLAVEAFPIL